MALAKSKKEFLFIESKDVRYPKLLKEIPDAPPGIYILGELPDDEIPKVAIVGTRKATASGRLLAKKISKKLGEKGIIIVSGLAMGVDTAAHEGALEVGAKTIAVLGCGLHEIYPRQNENLAHKILGSGGGIISEYPAGTPPLPHRFLERNRIVSGLSTAIIVIEAPIDSGALVTARLGAEQGREVLVFSGPAEHPNYRGSHKLIRDGARLVSSFEEIMEDLKSIPGMDFPQGFSFSFGESTSENILKTSEEKIIFKILKESGSPLGVDKIILATKLEPQIVNRCLALLSINGIIKETEGGYII